MTEQFILTLIDRFSGGSLQELLFEEGGSRLSLSKNAGTPPQGAALPEAAAAPRPPAPARASDATADGEYIRAPLVGTFYAAPGPDSPAFVSKGSVVKKGATLCIIEAMKMMNKLEAEFDCEILAVKAAPGDLVEFNQPLFEVAKR